MNTFNYFTNDPNHVPVPRNGGPIRFNVRAVAAAIDAIQTGIVPLGTSAGDEAARAFETIMANYQAIEKELVILRYFKGEVEAIFHRGADLLKNR